MTDRELTGKVHSTVYHQCQRRGYAAPVDVLMEIGVLPKEKYEDWRRGNTLSLRHLDRKGFIRLSSIDGYTEDELCAVLAGEKEHTPRKKRTQTTQKKNTLLIDIEAKLQTGKGGGYERWAKVFNVKQMAQTYNYLREHGLLDYAELEEKASAATEQFHALSAQIKAAEGRMAEIAVLKTHIINYTKTRDIYAGYRKAGYSKKYLTEHKGDILLHKAAKNAFDELGVKKLPSVKSLQEEYAKLLCYRRKRRRMPNIAPPVTRCASCCSTSRTWTRCWARMSAARKENRSMTASNGYAPKRFGETRSRFWKNRSKGFRDAAPDKQRAVFAAAETARKAKWVPLCPAYHVYQKFPITPSLRFSPLLILQIETSDLMAERLSRQSYPFR